MFFIIDKFSKYLWCIHLKNKISKTITEDFLNILRTSKRSPLKKDNNRGSEWYNSVFQNFLKVINIYHYSRFTDKEPSIEERGIRTIRSLIKIPVFLKGNANWLSELPSVIIKYIDTNHHSVKKTPIQASNKANEKEVFSNLQDQRVRQQPKNKLGQLVRTADFKRVFS